MASTFFLPKCTVPNHSRKKYKSYNIQVDPAQDDKATEILLWSLERPHMRAFHCSWLLFFAAFFLWFAITPLLDEIQADLGLSKKDVWTSSIASVGGTIIMRLILGPLCDKWGPRFLFTAVLCAAAVPTACTGLIQNAFELALVRLLIGIA